MCNSSIFNVLESVNSSSIKLNEYLRKTDLTISLYESQNLSTCSLNACITRNEEFSNHIKRKAAYIQHDGSQDRIYFNAYSKVCEANELE